MATLPLSQLKRALASVARTDHLDSGQREHIDRWNDHPRADEIWSKIQDKAQERHPNNAFYASPRFAKFFVRCVLATRSIAEGLDQRREQRDQYLKHAEQAESLAEFLSNLPEIGMPPPIPFGMQLAQSLQQAAKLLRVFANPRNVPGLMRISIKDVNGSRTRVAFMNWMSHEIVGICGEPMDDVVGVLNDISFDLPEVTTLDQVKSARSPTTRAGRQHRPKSSGKVASKRL